MSLFAPGKLRDFFRYYDDKDPQHREAVKRLEESVRRDAPQLLSDGAYWVEAWRKPAPKPEPAPKVLSVNLKDRVAIKAQQTSTSCGACSCAMAVNTITGTNYSDLQWDARHRNVYGLDLLSGLKQDCPKHSWRDAGRPRADLWPDVLESLSAGCPAVCGLNGPHFSPSGHGHIVCIVGVTSKTVIFADPNGGRLRELSRWEFENAQEYPQGNFVFLALPK